MADDGSGAANATSSAVFTIKVNNIDPTVPADDDTATNEVAEGAATGTTVGLDVSSTDPNGTASGGDVTFSLTDTAGGRFQIDVDGVVTVDNGALLDGLATYTITVQSSDEAGGTSTADFAINVLKVEPTITDLNSNHDEPCDSSAGGVVTLDGAFSDPAGLLDTHSVEVD